MTLRAIDRLIKSPDFEYFYLLTKDTNYIDQLVLSLDKEGIINWLKRKRRTDIYTMDTVSLRQLARQSSFPDWRTAPREIIIEQLMEKS